MTWRRLGVLIRSLPPESATKTAIRNNMNPLHTASAAKSSDAAQAPWSHTEMLLALLVDNIRWLIFVTLRVNGNKKAKAPEPLARPGTRLADVDTEPVLHALGEFAPDRCRLRGGVPSH